MGIFAHFHAIADCIDRIRWFDRPALALIVLDDQCEKVETIGVRRVRLRFVFEVPPDLLERRVIVGLRAERQIIFFAMIRSPDRCDLFGTGTTTRNVEPQRRGERSG